MKLKLYWKSRENVQYELGVLSYRENEYVFEINIEGLKDAIHHGCYGIGNFDLKQLEYRSNELFDFFENRLPEERELKTIINSNNIKPDDKMKILEITKGKKFIDSYWLEREV